MNAYLVVPSTTDVGQVFERELLEHIRLDPRSRSAGVLVVMPNAVTPTHVLCAASLWSDTLRRCAQVNRVGIMLSIAAYSNAESILPRCVRAAAAQSVELTFFHEAQLETDVVRAWSERRAPRRKRVTTDMFVKLAERYMERNDAHSAQHALELAERSALDVQPNDGEHGLWRLGPSSSSRSIT